MSSAISEINESMQNAVAAQQAGDYADALRHMESAYMRICVLPNSQFEDERLEWKPEGIKPLIDYLQAKVSAQGTAGAARTSLIRPNEVLYKRG